MPPFTSLPKMMYLTPHQRNSAKPTVPKKEIQEAQRTHQARDRFIDPRERIDPTSLDEVTQRIAQRIAMQKESVSKEGTPALMVGKEDMPALLVERDNKENYGSAQEDVSLVLDDDDSLCGIEFIDDECKEEQTSNFKYESFPTPLSRRRSDASDDDDDSSALSHGILLSPKRAVGNNNYQQHRHVSFSPPNHHHPRIHSHNPKEAVSTIAEIKDDESFLERMFVKMFVCGGMNNAVDFDSY